MGTEICSISDTLLVMHMKPSVSSNAPWRYISISMIEEAELARVLKPAMVGTLSKCLTSYGLPILLDDKCVKKLTGGKHCPVDRLLSIMGVLVDKKNNGRKICSPVLAGLTSRKPVWSPMMRPWLPLHIHSIIVNSAGGSPRTVAVTPPGSKPIPNQALVLAALGSGECRVKHSDDTEH